MDVCLDVCVCTSIHLLTARRHLSMMPPQPQHIIRLEEYLRRGCVCYPRKKSRRFGPSSPHFSVFVIRRTSDPIPVTREYVGIRPDSRFLNSR